MQTKLTIKLALEAFLNRFSNQNKTFSNKSSNLQAKAQKLMHQKFFYQNNKKHPPRPGFRCWKAETTLKKDLWCILHKFHAFDSIFDCWSYQIFP